MRAISLGTLVAVCLFATACSSTMTSNGGQGGQVGSGGAGDGGHQTGAGGSGTGGAGKGGTGAGGAGTGGTGAGGAGSGGHTGVGGHSNDAGQDATAGMSDCNPACGSGSVCVGTGIQGGAIFLPNDAGVCPAGRHVENGFCLQDLTFACMPIPSGCNGAATCTCASSLCNGRTCGTPTLDELTCIQFVP
jgi:hypothetical protein